MIAFDEVFRRHPGVYDVIHTTTRPNSKRKGGETETVKVATHLHKNAREVELLIRREVAADEYATLTIFAATRGDTGCIGWINRGNIDAMFKEVTDARMELPDERSEAALLHGGYRPVTRRAKPLREVGDSSGAGEVQHAGAAPGSGPVRGLPAKVGRALVLGTGEWPGSAAAQLVREHYSQPGFRATPADACAAIGARLTEMGVAFPASLISRLKQKGLLITAPEEE